MSSFSSGTMVSMVTLLTIFIVTSAATAGRATSFFFLEQKKRNLRGNSRKSRVYSQQQMTLSSASAAATQNQKPVKRNLRGSMLRFFLTKERVSSTSGRSAGRHGTRTTAPGRAAANETVLELSSGRGRVAPEQEKSVGSLALLRAAKGRSSATTSNATTATLFSFTFSAPPKKLYPCWLIVAFYVDDFYSESAKRGLIQLLEETENMNCQLHLLVKDDDFLLQPETTAATASTTSTALRHLSAAKFREGGPCDHFVGAQAGRFWAGRSDVTATRWSGGGRVVCTEQPNNGRETASFANYTYEKYDEIQALYPLQTSPSERLGPSAITMDEEQEVARNRSASASPYLRLHYLPFPGFDHNRIDTIRNAFRQDPLSVGKSRAYFNHYNFPSAHLEDPSVDYLADAGSFLIAEYDGHKIARARFRPPVSPSGTIVDPMNLRSWYESWIREPAWEQAGNYFSGMKGAQSTTSVLLLQRKKELYREVGQECSTGGSFGNEAGMFVERLMPVIFGYGAENKATEYEDTTSLQNELPNIKTSADRSIVQRIFANVKF